MTKHAHKHIDDDGQLVYTWKMPFPPQFMVRLNGIHFYTMVLN